MRVPKIAFVFDRRHASSKVKKGAIEIRVAYGGKQKLISTGVSVLPSQWNKKDECVKMRSDAVMLNKVLAGVKLACLDMVSKMAEEGMVDLSRLNSIMRPSVHDETFIEYVDRRMYERPVSDATRQKYRTFLNALKEWGRIVSFSDITARNIRAFDEWLHGKTLKNGAHFLQSNIFFYHKTLKIFINDAIMDERMSENPYNAKRIRIDKGETRQIACLTEEQVGQIENLSLDGHMDKVRDLFLFQCYTGLAYSDMQKFDLKKCEVETDGSILVRGKRTKTKTEYMFYLMPKAVGIAKKYGGRLPRISNQRYNEFLKLIGIMIGEKRLHSHMGRSTFASTMLNHGVSTDVLRHTLGHTTTIQTNRYATMREQTIKDAFRKLQ